MQVVAWAQMLRDYSAQKGVLAGVMETFDGEHPCKMCVKIAEAKQEEERRHPSPLDRSESASFKWLAPLVAVEVSGPVRNEVNLVIGFAEPVPFGSQWTTRPPVPPPRPIA